jgi:hypothetical protein
MAQRLPDSLEPSQSGPVGRARTVGIAALVIAVVVGVQLGRIPLRYRRQIWMLQGFLAGGLVGYVVGRLGGAAAAADNRPGRPPHRPGP